MIETSDKVLGKSRGKVSIIEVQRREKEISILWVNVQSTILCDCIFGNHNCGGVGEVGQTWIVLSGALEADGII